MSQYASTITLPSHWACYLINGDASGLDDGEAERIAAHLNAELPADAAIVDVIEDSERFTWSFRLYGGDASGGDVADFTVLQPGARAAVQRAGADDAPAMVPQQVQQQQARDMRAGPDVMRATAQAFLDADEAWGEALRREFGRRAAEARYSPAGKGDVGSPLRALYCARYAAYSAWCEARCMPVMPDPACSAVTVKPSCGRVSA
ncbi:hypothetical protein [Methylobacterium radiotolerans]|uniref:hypothetical protein n=1 Tax=Methylobacterium radiotolerans TaxID=31998 RepID=UPI0038D0A8A9